MTHPSTIKPKYEVINTNPVSMEGDGVYASKWGAGKPTLRLLVSWNIKAKEAPERFLL